MPGTPSQFSVVRFDNTLPGRGDTVAGLESYFRKFQLPDDVV